MSSTSQPHSKSTLIAAALIGILSLLAGWHWQQHLEEKPQDALSAAKSALRVPQYRPDFSLPDLSGRLRTIREWDGSWVILNFWASWCAPCRDEVPVLIQAQKREVDNLSVLGIALDDETAARQFAQHISLNYPSLIEDPFSGQILSAFGNPRGLLPYTVVIAPDGKIRDHHLGPLTSSMLQALLKSAGYTNTKRKISKKP